MTMRSNPEQSDSLEVLADEQHALRARRSAKLGRRSVTITDASALSVRAWWTRLPDRIRMYWMSDEQKGRALRDDPKTRDLLFTPADIKLIEEIRAYNHGERIIIRRANSDEYDE